MSTNNQPKATSRSNRASRSAAVSTASRKRLRRRRTARLRNSNMDSGSQLTMAYVESLNDPFLHAGVNLGWGTMVPTTIHTAYLRASATANADGTLAIALYMGATNLVTIANAGAAVNFATAASYLSATDSAAVASNFSMGRIISGGIRAYPNLAFSSAPGAAYCGAIPGLRFQDIGALTPNDLAASPYASQFKSYEGVTALLRPQDPGSFQYHTEVVSSGTNWAGALISPVSVPFVCFTGIGAGTTVFFEAILNFEGIAASVHSSAALGDSVDQNRGPTLSDYWPTAERLWSGIKHLVSSPAIYGAATGLMKEVGMNLAAGSALGPFTGPAFSLGKGLLSSADLGTFRYPLSMKSLLR